MSKKRRVFSVEYKREAVKLVTEQGYSVAQAYFVWMREKPLHAVG